MLAMTLSDAKTISVGLVAAFAVGSILAVWILKSVVQKLLVVGVLAVFGYGVWTQRAALQDCADKVQDAYEFDGINPTIVDTDCSFFGATITISDPRDTTSDDTETTE